MKPNHHPAPGILVEYAAGMLEPGFGLVVGAHVEGCGACRINVAAYEAVSGSALEGLPRAGLAEGALAQAMTRLDAQPLAVTAYDARPLLERLPHKPRKWVAPGVWVAAVETPHALSNRVYLLSVAPGGATAQHEHEGREFCAVLKGAYTDALGLFEAGDFAAAESDFNHQPVVRGKESCVCLFATEGRLKPRGFLSRMAFAYSNV
jgi:putative transcriptional regulator